ncbi:MarR family winged helix-turn-helix transcriptional regulator [Actinoplanes flavus]|uniref:MarR family transcriptional regulator n=1 Tax=Actinoplanes flavus TaxID=2820290 RepID=A0ABS3UFL1_9ACTN|nr:MarR family transcriptional regulator [Actinoplanes flavus]MBO3736563.1 MarR family transcriptional regulator [Actinoplanes flavus]
MTDGDTPRAQLNGEIITELHRYAGHVQQIGGTFAARHGLGAADLQALMLIVAGERSGQPVTPGELREALNFSSGSITGLIDRLEAAGHVYRGRDADDRRKVLLRQAAPAVAVARGFFGPIARRTEAVLDDFTEPELDVVRRFLAALSTAMGEHRDDLRAR